MTGVAIYHLATAFAVEFSPMNRQPLPGPWAWHGSSLTSSESWVHALTPRELSELDAALDGLCPRGGSPRPVDKSEFPLPTLGRRLAAIAGDLEHGCGVAKLTGLPVDAYDDHALRTLWFGIGSHLGTPVYQDTDGELMRAICDEGPDVGARYGEVRIDTQGDAQGDDQGSIFLSIDSDLAVAPSQVPGPGTAAA